MALEKDYLQGPSASDRAKSAMFQGACIFGIGAISTVGSWLLLDVVWLVTPIIAAVGAFRFLYGLVVYLTGWE